MDKIKIINEKDINVGYKSKQKRSLEKNIFNAHRKSLTMLGGRQRRCSNIGLREGSGMNVKLPVMKNTLKLEDKSKNGVNERGMFKNEKGRRFS